MMLLGGRVLSSNKQVLVTGADGFIGSHLTESLVKKGYSVRAFVLYNSFNNWGWLDRIPSEIKEEIEQAEKVLDFIYDENQKIKDAMRKYNI